MQMSKSLLILGAGQYGQVAKEIAEQIEMFETVVLLDDLSDGVSYKNKITEYSFAFAAAVNSGAGINDCCYIGANATNDCGSEVYRGSTICCGATVVDNTYVETQTEVKYGQICYGNKLAKKTPEGNNYCFEDGM